VEQAQWCEEEEFCTEFFWSFFKPFIEEIQTNSCYQFYALLNANNIFVLFHMMIEHNHDLCGGVTEWHGCS
jgi:hypothetical protein